jgi:cytochrome c oxidase cbb3-type subunit I
VDNAPAPHLPRIDGRQAARRERLAAQRVAIDESTRLPVLVFFASAVSWLLAGSLLADVASIKLHAPWFLSSASWLTFGRVRPAHLNTVIFGWASMAGIGTMLWLMARLSRAELRYPRMLVAAAVLWNVGVLVGTVGILGGHSTGIEWMEFPPYVPPILTAAFAILAVWSILTFHDRREAHVYVSQWYLFAAIFWFPWLYIAANLLLIFRPVTGVTHASINWWFAHNVLGLWFTPIGLASVYYLIPKVLGRPIYSYYLSILGFWALALFYNWNGAHHLVGGPLPAWLITTSIVASIMMLIPVVTVAINHHSTMVGHFGLLRYSPTLRFIVFGAMSYTAVSVQGSLQALRHWNVATHFTHYTIAHSHLGMYAFFTMVMFGSMYYIVPRLTGWEWASARLIRAHFWCTAVGILFYFLALTYGGVLQGLRLNDPKISFVDVMNGTVPYLIARSGAGGLLTVGHVAFAILLAMNLLHLGAPRSAPMLLGDRAEYERELASAQAEGEAALAAGAEEDGR